MDEFWTRAGAYQPHVTFKDPETGQVISGQLRTETQERHGYTPYGSLPSSTLAAGLGLGMAQTAASQAAASQGSGLSVDQLVQGFKKGQDFTQKLRDKRTHQQKVEQAGGPEVYARLKATEKEQAEKAKTAWDVGAPRSSTTPTIKHWSTDATAVTQLGDLTPEERKRRRLPDPTPTPPATDPTE
jgi:hypothetical protein